MPNANYIKGIRKERKLVTEARNKGKIAFRSAGSHSKVDVCVIDLKAKTICFFQCKPDNISEKAKNKMLQEMYELNDMFSCSFDVV